MRVYQLAQELGVTTDEVLRLAGELGSPVQSTLASLDEAIEVAIRGVIAGSTAGSEQAFEPSRRVHAGILGPTAARSPEAVRVGPRTRLSASVPLRLEARGGDVLGGAVLGVLCFYLVINRVIPDRFVLPFGASVRFYEVVLLVLAGVWGLWIVVQPKPFPTGLLGLSGLLLVAALLFAPFAHAGNMTAFQAGSAERGVIRVAVLAGLFLASYHLSSRLAWARRILALIVALAALQALLAILEFQTTTPVFFFDDLARGLGMIDDPRGIRGEFVDVFERLTGEVRSVGTAPHPIVLSAVLALGIMVATGWWVDRGSADGRRWWLLLALVALVLGLPTTNSRTGFVILAFAFVPLLVLTIRHLPRLIPFMGGAAALMAIAFALSPDTPRLLLNTFTRPDTDPNLEVRLERFDLLPELVSANPYLGVGYLTHDPAIQIFDNAYNLALVETGMIGLLLFVSFFWMVMVRCWRSYHRGTPRERPVLFAGVAGALALLIGGITFDAWTFDQFLPTCLVVMGLGAGLSRVVDARVEEGASGAPPRSLVGTNAV